jgi:hypothetical protein
MRHIELYWTHKLGRVAQVQPHILDAPAGFGRTSAQAVADLVRQDASAKGLPVKMAPKPGKETIYQPAPHFGRW